MSQALSPSTSRTYGRARVVAARRLSRSTFYARRKRLLQPVPLKRRGPKTTHSDADLVAQIRQVIADSPFHGEGHRKVWALTELQYVEATAPALLIVTLLIATAYWWRRSPPSRLADMAYGLGWGVSFLVTP